MNIELNTLSLVNNSGILTNAIIYNYIFSLIPILRIINLQRRLFKFINFFSLQFFFFYYFFSFLLLFFVVVVVLFYFEF